MKRVYVSWLLVLVLLMSAVSCPAWAAVISVTCRPGETIRVVFTLSEDGEQPDGVMGRLSYNEEVFILVPSGEIIGMDGVNILNRKPVTLSFKVNQYAPAGTYTIELKVIEAYDADGKKYTDVRIEPVQVTIRDTEAAAPEHTPVPTGMPADPVLEQFDAENSSPFAVSQIAFNGERAPGNRTQETNLGDLIADSMIWYVVNSGIIREEDLRKVVGITNGGAIRAPLAPGGISMADIHTVLPFGNTVAVTRVTGEELLEALEASTFCTPDPVGGFPQTSGIIWTLDTATPYDQGELYVVNGKESVYYGPKSIQRVIIQSVNGEAFDPEAEYVVVTNNFLATGPDTYAAFQRAYTDARVFDTGIPMDAALYCYILEQLNGEIAAEPAGGRLTVR